MSRYSRNMNTLTPEENDRLKDFRVCVIGCGGLGGYIIEMLGRLGIGHITAVDGDVFEASNLNRQILSDTEVLGLSKAETARKRMELVNPLIKVYPIWERFTETNGEDILKGHHVVVDALDNIKSRLLLQKTAENLNIPMVHGAIAGWYGQVTTILPGDRTLDEIYISDEDRGIEKELGNPSFTPALAAALQVSEVVKILINRGDLLSRKLAVINLLAQEYEVIPL